MEKYPRKYQRELVGLATDPQLWRLNQLNLPSSLTYGWPITKADAHRTLTEAQLTGVWNPCSGDGAGGSR